MNANQRRLLVAACVLGAVLLHVWNGAWMAVPEFSDRIWCTLDLGWFAYKGCALEGLAIPAALLVVAVFVRLGGRQPATAR